MTTSINRWGHRAVNFGQRHQHRRFNGAKALRTVGPLTQCLKFERLGVHIGHVQFRQRGDCAIVVIVGWPAHKAETRQRHHHINTIKIGIHRGPPIKPTGKGRDRLQTLCFEGADNRIIVGRIIGQNIRPQHQNPDLRTIDLGKLCEISRNAFGGQIGVIQTHFGVFTGRSDRDAIPFKTAGIARNQHTQHLFDVFI